MEQDAVQKIQQRIAELPEDVRAAIQSNDLHQKVLAIGGKHQLHIDQVGELEDEVMLAMLGFSPLETLGKRLSDALHIAPDAGERLAADINTELFGSIRESMKKFAAAKTQAANPAPAPTMPAATAAPAAPKPAPTPAAVVMPPVAPDMHKADVVLTEKTVSIPAPAAPKAPEAAQTGNPIYKADPYREPV